MPQYNIIRFDTIDSTNSFLKAHCAEYPDLTVIVSKIQTGGKGRFNRGWLSPEGGLWFSVLVHHTNPEKAFLLTFAAAVAMADTLASQSLCSEIKWPNDLLANRKKLCGILTENIISGDECDSIVGVGININNAPPLETSTSVKIGLGKAADPNILLEHFMDSFAGYCGMFRQGEYTNIIDSWNSHWNGSGKRISVNTIKGGICGIAKGISADGALIIQTDDGEVEIIEGDLSM